MHDASQLSLEVSFFVLFSIIWLHIRIARAGVLMMSHHAVTLYHSLMQEVLCDFNINSMIIILGEI